MAERADSPAAPPAESVRRSAQALARSAGGQEDSADRRTQLAADRTYAAWVRTGLAALASGVGAKSLFARLLPGWFGELVGVVLALFSAFCFVAAVWRELRPGAPPPTPDTRQLPRPLLLGLNGFLVLVALAVLVAICLVPS